MQESVINVKICQKLEKMSWEISKFLEESNFRISRYTDNNTNIILIFSNFIIYMSHFSVCDNAGLGEANNSRLAQNRNDCGESCK